MSAVNINVNLPYWLKLKHRYLFLFTVFHLVNKWDRWLYETDINYLKFWIKDFRQWILMATGDTHVADPLDTMYHEMDSIVHSHHVYKPVWLPKIGEQLILERSLPANVHNKIAVVVIKDSHVVSRILSQNYSWVVFCCKIIHGSHSVLLHKGALLSVRLLGEGRIEKKLRNTMYKYLLLWIHKRHDIYYCYNTVSPAINQTKCIYKNSRNLR